MFQLYFSEYIMIPSGLKNNLLMLNGYTFSRMSTDLRWYCSKKKGGCKAKVVLDSDQKIVYASNEHNHAPPQYHITANGNYVLIKGT